jgi:hypothetical protein
MRAVAKTALIALFSLALIWTQAVFAAEVSRAHCVARPCCAQSACGGCCLGSAPTPSSPGPVAPRVPSISENEFQSLPAVLVVASAFSCSETSCVSSWVDSSRGAVVSIYVRNCSYLI